MDRCAEFIANGSGIFPLRDEADRYWKSLSLTVGEMQKLYRDNGNTVSDIESTPAEREMGLLRSGNLQKCFHGHRAHC